MEATKHGPGNDAAGSEPDDRPAVGGVQRERAMGARRVVMRGVLRQQRPQVPLVDDYQMVETLASQRPDEALGDRVRLRRPDRREQGSDADPGDARDERAAVAAVAVVDEVAWLLTPGVAAINWRQPHSAVGCAVTFRWTIRRRSCVMMKKTYRVWKVTVGAVKKSAAQMCGA